MSTRLFLLLTPIFALLQGAFLPTVFAEGTLIVTFILSRNFNRVFLPLFVSGMVFDLVQDQRLGITSAIFLSVALFIYLSRDLVRIRSKSGLVYLLVLVFTVGFARGELVFSNVPWSPVIVSVCLMSLIYLFIWQPMGNEGIRIR